MKIDFKFLRVDILSKFFLKITLMEILNFPCWYSSITLSFQLGNKHFWNFSKQIIYSSGKLLMILKCSYLSQKIMWGMALGKSTTSSVKLILIWVLYHPHGGLALKIKRYGLSTQTRLDMLVVRATTLYLVMLIVQKQWLYT